MALTDNLVSYWKLDDASGDAIDAHGSNDGTVTNATQGATGLINDAYSFDGTNDWVNCGNDASLQLTAMSVSFWCNTSSNTRSIITKGSKSRGNANERDWDITGNGTNLYFLVSNGSSYIVNISDTWPDMSTGFHHVVCTWDGTTDTDKAIMYVDGVEFAKGTATNTNPAASFVLYLGGKHSSSPYEFSGTLDEVGIWSRSLTSGEVTSLYNSGSGLAYPLTEAGGNAPTGNINGPLVGCLGGPI